MLISLLKGATDDAPVATSLETFDALRGYFTEHTRAAPGPKGKTPLATAAFSPAEFDGYGRRADNVVRIHFGVLDLDGITGDELATVLGAAAPLASVFYSTFSYAPPDKLSARLVLPFDRPVRRDEWKAFWQRLNTHFAGHLDPATKDPSRLYFFPVARSDAPTILLHTEGRSLCVSDILALTLPARTARQATSVRGVVSTDSAVSVDAIRTLANRLHRQGNATGKRLIALCDGTQYAQAGERDAVLWDVATALARAFPVADATALVQGFRPSLDLTNAQANSGDTESDLEKLAEKIERARLKTAEDVPQVDSGSDLTRRCREAFAGARDTPYTQEEVDSFASLAGVDGDAFRSRWIVQQGSAYYLYFAGDYLSPVSKDSVVNAAVRDLAPAAPHGVSCYAMTDQGPALKSRETLVAEYGVVARSTRIELAAQRSRYDALTHTLIEATCPIRPVTPSFHAEIDLWLRLLGGDQAERLLDWCAFLTRLDQPCVGLYIHADPGVGKSLFAKGLSRLWTTGGPSELGKAIADFNASLCRCPLVHADEKMPDALRGADTGRMREFLQNTTRLLSRKYLPDAEMSGAMRFIFTANNDSMLDAAQEHLSGADIAAIADRFLYCRSDPRAATYLESLGGWAKLNATWIACDAIAAHALWLRDCRGAQVNGRFMIAGGGGEIGRRLTTQSGIRSAVCQWLISYLQRPTLVDTAAGDLIVVKDGGLYVKTQALTDLWERYVTNIRPPATNKAAGALKGLSHADRKQIRAVDGTAHAYYLIDLANLYHWSEANGVSSREEIDKALRRDTRRLAATRGAA